jgi:hypothetical protein
MHQSAEFFRLVGRAGIYGNDRNALGDGAFDRTLEHIVVGDRRDDARRIGGGRLLNDTRHIGDVAGRRIAVLDLYAEVVFGVFQGVLDRVPPRV